MCPLTATTSAHQAALHPRWSATHTFAQQRSTTSATQAPACSGHLRASASNSPLSPPACGSAGYHPATWRVQCTPAARPAHTPQPCLLASVSRVVSHPLSILQRAQCCHRGRGVSVSAVSCPAPAVVGAGTDTRAQPASTYRHVSSDLRHRHVSVPTG